MQQEGVVGRIGFTFLPSWVTLFAVVQPTDSTITVAPLCWVFCLCPRELVGPAGLYAQVLGRRCRCGPWQAIRLLISQSSSFVLGTARAAAPATLAWDACACSRGIQPLRVCEALKRLCAWSVQPAHPAALGLSLSGGRGHRVTESRRTRVRGFGPVGGAANLCSRCSGRFQVWAPLRGFMCVPPVR